MHIEEKLACLRVGFEWLDSDGARSLLSSFFDGRDIPKATSRSMSMFPSSEMLAVLLVASDALEILDIFLAWPEESGVRPDALSVTGDEGLEVGFIPV
jgi:hypothetical protein